MTPDQVAALGRQALEVLLLLSAPFLLAALLVGLAGGLLQAVTQIQEQTLAFVPKFLAILAVFLLTLPWAMDVLLRYAAGLFGGVSRLGG